MANSMCWWLEEGGTVTAVLGLALGVVVAAIFLVATGLAAWLERHP